MRVEAPPAASKPGRKTRPRQGRAMEVRDPWAVTDEPASRPAPKRTKKRPADAPPETGIYGLTDSALPGREAELDRAKKHWKPNEPRPGPTPPTLIEPYEVTDEPPAPEPPPPVEPEPTVSAAALEHEIALRDRTPPNPDPAFPLISGVYNFPFYQSSLRAWLWMSLGGTAVGVMATMVMALVPR